MALSTPGTQVCAPPFDLVRRGYDPALVDEWVREREQYLARLRDEVDEAEERARERALEDERRARERVERVLAAVDESARTLMARAEADAGVELESVLPAVKARRAEAEEHVRSATALAEEMCRRAEERMATAKEEVRRLLSGAEPRNDEAIAEISARAVEHGERVMAEARRAAAEVVARTEEEAVAARDAARAEADAAWSLVEDRLDEERGALSALEQRRQAILDTLRGVVPPPQVGDVRDTPATAAHAGRTASDLSSAPLSAAVPGRRPVGTLTILVDPHQLVPWRFGSLPVTTLRRELAVGQYAVTLEQTVVAAVERTTTAELERRAADGSLAELFVPLEQVERGAIVVDDWRTDPKSPGRSSAMVRALATLQVDHPDVPVVLCRERWQAEHWTFAFLSAALARLGRPGHSRSRPASPGAGDADPGPRRGA